MDKEAKRSNLQDQSPTIQSGASLLLLQTLSDYYYHNYKHSIPDDEDVPNISNKRVFIALL